MLRHDGLVAPHQWTFRRASGVLNCRSTRCSVSRVSALAVAAVVIATLRWHGYHCFAITGKSRSLQAFAWQAASSQRRRHLLLSMAVRAVEDDLPSTQAEGSRMSRVGTAGLRESVMQRMSDAQSAKEFLDTLSHEILKPTFDELHVAAAFTRLARNARSLEQHMCSRPCLEDLMQREEVLLRQGTADASHAANVLWAIATLRDRAPGLKRLVPLLVDLLSLKATDLSAVEVSKVLWSCGALRLKQQDSKDLMPVLIEITIDKADQLSAQSVSNIVWATAVLRKEAPELREVLPVMVEMVADQAADLAAPDIANRLWATATLRGDAPCLQQMVPMLMEQAVSKADTLSEQHVANILWSVGLLKLTGTRVDRLVEAMLQRAMRNVRAFKTQELANLCWGLSLLQLHGHRAALEAFMSSVAEAVSQAAPTLRGKAAELDLPQLVCSFAKLGVRHSKLLAAVQTRTSEILPRMNDWGLSALTWSFQELTPSNPSNDCFLRRAWAEVQRRGIPPAHVGRSRLGPVEWRHGRPMTMARKPS